jgi:RecG-like helicase
MKCLLVENQLLRHRREKDRLTVYGFAKEEIAKGRQVYFVYPLIEESETLDYKNLMEGFEHIAEIFPFQIIRFLCFMVK